MSKPTITAYLKTTCGWSNGIRALLENYDLPYEEKDIIIYPHFRAEMEQKSGQRLSPCVLVNEVMLADVGSDELEEYLLANHLVTIADRKSDEPINSACQH